MCGGFAQINRVSLMISEKKREVLMEAGQVYPKNKVVLVKKTATNIDKMWWEKKVVK